jgi:catechol-2,3-dioxygenase
MAAVIKAEVFKTPRLQESKIFYKNRLGLTIVESSIHHFVAHASGVRIVFVSVKNRAGVELYLANTDRTGNHNEIKVIEDVNDIKYVICSGY